MTPECRKRRNEASRVWRSLNKEKNSATCREWRLRNAEYSKQFRNDRRKKIVRVLQRYKTIHGCSRCGYKRCADALTFHHRDPSQKESKLGNVGGTWSWAKIKLEIRKCDLLCQNCHAEEHYRIRQARVQLP